MNQLAVIFWLTLVVDKLKLQLADKVKFQLADKVRYQIAGWLIS